MRSSAIFFVSVVTRTRWSFSVRSRISAIEIVDLALRRPDLDLGVDEARGPDDLLDDVRPAHAQLVGARGGAHVDDLPDALAELVEPQRPVVDRAREAEPELDERRLARQVALVHAVELTERDVRLVEDHQVVVGEVVEQRERGASRRRGRRCAASSSRSRCRTRPRGASRGRTRCASAAARPPGACPRPPGARAARAAPPRSSRSPASSGPRTRRSATPGRSCCRRCRPSRPRRWSGRTS